MNTKSILLALLAGALAGCCLPAAAADAAADASQPVAAVAATKPSAASAPRRLKFRNGPVCLCATGLSEKDIEAAQAATQDKAGATGESGGNHE